MRLYRVFLPFLMVFLPFACSAQDDVLVEDEEQEVLSVSKLSFPNAFSPNGDGKNDKFMAKECENIAEFHAYIFNAGDRSCSTGPILPMAGTARTTVTQ